LRFRAAGQKVWLPARAIGVRPPDEGYAPGRGGRKLLNANAVLRWEYRPGSTLFVVWSQGRNDFAADGRFQLRRDASDLFRAPGTNVLLINASYWLNL
jgi:hypothetical protein